MLKFLLLAVIPVIIAVISVAYTSRESDQVKKLTAAQAKERMDGSDPVTVVDVREPEEYDAGHIPGAVSLPVGSLSRKAAGVLPDKNTPILVYCETGERSARAASRLAGMGYADVSDFGGLRSWSYDVVTTQQEEQNT